MHMQLQCHSLLKLTDSRKASWLGFESREKQKAEGGPPGQKKWPYLWLMGVWLVVGVKVMTQWKQALLATRQLVARLRGNLCVSNQMPSASALYGAEGIWLLTHKFPCCRATSWCVYKSTSFNLNFPSNFHSMDLYVWHNILEWWWKHHQECTRTLTRA